MEKVQIVFVAEEGQSKEGTNQEQIVVEGVVNGQDAVITIEPFALDQSIVASIKEHEGFDYDEKDVLFIDYPEESAPGE